MGNGAGPAGVSSGKGPEGSANKGRCPIKAVAEEVSRRGRTAGDNFGGGSRLLARRCVDSGGKWASPGQGSWASGSPTQHPRVQDSLARKGRSVKATW